MQMQWHQDINEAFKPLLEHVRQFFPTNEDEVNKIVGSYMYMGHDHEKSYYKHHMTRDYINIFQDGTVKGSIEGLNPEEYEPCDICQTLTHGGNMFSLCDDCSEKVWTWNEIQDIYFMKDGSRYVFSTRTNTYQRRD